MSLDYKYRPSTLADFCGNDGAIRQLQGIVQRPGPWRILLCGPPGTGKSTLAQISGHSLSTMAVSKIGNDKGMLDYVRSVPLWFSQYPMFGKAHVLIIDELDAVSHDTAEVLRGVLSSMPSYAAIIATTNQSACPKNLALWNDRTLTQALWTRFVRLEIGAPKDTEVSAYLRAIAQAENKDGLPEAHYLELARRAGGNVREALQALELSFER